MLVGEPNVNPIPVEVIGDQDGYSRNKVAGGRSMIISNEAAVVMRAYGIV